MFSSFKTTSFMSTSMRGGSSPISRKSLNLPPARSSASTAASAAGSKKASTHQPQHQQEQHSAEEEPKTAETTTSAAASIAAAAAAAVGGEGAAATEPRPPSPGPGTGGRRGEGSGSLANPTSSSAGLNEIMPSSEAEAEAEAEAGVTSLPLEDEDIQSEQGSELSDGGLEKLSLGPRYLKGEADRYDGIIVDPSCLPADIPTFVDALRASLDLWKSQERKGVWLKLPTANANLVFPAIEAGFGYHHAEPTYVMLTYWIPESPCTIPSNASHQVGVGAFVLNDQRQVLAVQEKNGPLRGSGIWKMPTGLINQGEDIHDGAVREVKEETGVDTEFLEVIGFRQGHQVSFEKSDLFFLCVLRPLSSTIVKQDSEIEAAQWMPLDEFAVQPFFQRSMLRKMLDICVASTEGQYRGFGSRALHAGFQRLPSYFYYNVQDSKENSNL